MARQNYIDVCNNGCTGLPPPPPLLTLTPTGACTAHALMRCIEIVCQWSLPRAARTLAFIFASSLFRLSAADRPTLLVGVGKVGGIAPSLSADVGNCLQITVS